MELIVSKIISFMLLLSFKKESPCFLPSPYFVLIGIMSILVNIFSLYFVS